MDNVLPRELALKNIWGNDDYFNGRSMDVYITKIRKYLKDDPSLEIINIHGKGYRFNTNAIRAV
jgi:DNA-binding response OmpR family regulator